MLWKIKKIVRDHQIFLGFLFLGIAIRAFASFSLNHLIDITWHLAFARSVFDTGDLTEGFMTILRAGDTSQIHGKIWYQIMAAWLWILEQLRLIRVDYLLDTKAFSDSANYLVGFRQWSPPLYQLTAIKAIQFVWDMLLAISMYGLASRLRVKHPSFIILFWALNPFLIMVGYGIMMTEIAMLFGLVGGIYYWVCATDAKTEKNRIIHYALATGFFAFGAVIKQLPLLMIPVMLLTVIHKKRVALTIILSFLTTYTLLRQPWAGDHALIQNYFFFSEQSMGLFRYKIAEIPLFLIFYGSLLWYVFAKRFSLIKEPVRILELCILVIAIVYAVDATFFVQFLTWILPLAGLYALYDKKNMWMLFFVFGALYLKLFMSHDYYAGLLAPTIGSRFYDLLHHTNTIERFISYKFLDLIFSFIVKAVYIVIGIVLFLKIHTGRHAMMESLEKIRTPFISTVLGIFLLYVGIFVGDFFIAKQHIKVPQYAFQTEWKELSTKANPMSVAVNNKVGYTIRALTLPLTHDGSNFNDATIFTIQTPKETFAVKVPDFKLPRNYENEYTIYFPKPIRDSSFTITISKEKNLNNVRLYEGRAIEQINSPGNSIYQGYDTQGKDRLVTYDFGKNKEFVLFLRGDYTFRDIVTGLTFHMSHTLKKIYFGTYFFMTFIFLSLGLGLIFKNRETLKRMKRE